MAYAMWKRLLKFSRSQSFFLFGARGTGKSTLLAKTFKASETLWVDLLNLEQEDELAKHPQNLIAQVQANSKKIRHVVIDEIQKVPKLLDVVQHLISTSDKQFILTGSSARKLKYGSANLLAGRAFVYHLFPFSFLELGKDFELQTALQYGLLPRIYQLESPKEKQEFLRAYALTYLREEIWAEQLIKRLDPFRRFLEVAAQMNGKILNYHQISLDVGVDDKTIMNYFSLLEDTLLGFFLEPFHSSFRKRLAQKPKFYFIDLGIVRALTHTLSLPIKSQTSFYGDLFEQLVIIEIYKLMNYFQPEYRLSFLQTKDNLEIDLVVERPGKSLCLIEIKSASQIHEGTVTTLQKISKELHAEAFCFSNDPRVKQFGQVRVMPWQKGIKELLESQT